MAYYAIATSLQNIFVNEHKITPKIRKAPKRISCSVNYVIKVAYWHLLLPISAAWSWL